MVRRRRLAAIVALSWLAAGCGYRPLGPPADVAPNIEIRMFENRSSQLGVERMLADALHEEFRRRGVLEPRYSGAAGAPPGLVMRGVIREVSVRATAFSSVGLALEDSIELVLEVSIARGESGEVVWRRARLTERERFTVSSDREVYDSNKQQALLRMSAALAGSIHDELFQSF